MRALLLLIFCLSLFAQQTPPNQIQIFAPAVSPVPPNTVGGAVTGAQGATTLYYWVVARYPGGLSSPTGPAIVINTVGSANLNAQNYVTVGWPGVPGATGYDVIRHTGPTYLPSCNTCAVVLNTPNSTVNDTGGGSAYPPAGVPVSTSATATFTIDNIDAGAPYVTMRMQGNSDNSYRLGLLSGAFVNGHYTQYQGGVLVDAGAALPGSGTVTSVSFTGGLISVATPTSTPALTVAGTSGGIPYFSSSSTWATTAALTANAPVIGGGAGSAPTVGSRSGNTTVFGTVSGALTSGNCVKSDVNGNLVDNGSTCASGGGAVSSVFTRTGAVVAAANDYNFNQLAGSVAASQMPALAGDCTTSAGAVTVTCGAAIGRTGNPLSQFASTTSAQLFGIISNPTGSGGSLVFATGPTVSGLIGTGATDFSGASSLKMRVAAGLTAATNGFFGYDSTNNMIHAAQSSADAFVPQFTVVPTNAHCATWVVSGSNYKLGDSACSGGGTVTVVSSGSLNSTSFVTGGGTTTLQTPSATSTLDSSGNANFAGIVTAVGGVSAGSSPPSVTAGTGGVDGYGEGTVPSVCAAVGVDCVYASSTQHGLLASFNNGSFLPLTQGPASATSGNLPSFNGTNGGLFQDSGIAAANVATAASTLTNHGVVLGAGSKALSVTAVGASNTVLHGNTGADPTYSAVSLTTDVTGVLPTANIALALANQTSIHGITAGTAAGDATLGQIIAHGATALDFGSTATGACATVITATATGAATTDVIIFNANASIKAVTGYVPAATGGFSIAAYPSSNTVNFEACNWTSGTVDPGSITVNWVVIR